MAFLIPTVLVLECNVEFICSSLTNKIQCYFCYRAPKLGHVLSDPLSNEENFLHINLKNIIFNLMNNPYKVASSGQEERIMPPLKFRRADELETTQKPCPGYDFDDTICKTIDDRVVCGYNKNIGEIQSQTTDLGNGCRIRGERLECGYLIGPFNYIRRPPANDQEKNQTDDNSSRQRRTVESQNATLSKSPNSSTSILNKKISFFTNTGFTPKLTTTTTTLRTPQTIETSITSITKFVTKKVKKDCTVKDGKLICTEIKS